MIDFSQVSFRYTSDSPLILKDVNWHIPEGDMCLVVGRTGSGKSTLLRAINGLVPHFTGGTLFGEVQVAGRSTSQFPPREFADLVGMVSQDPMSNFVTDVVEDELAYGMESLGVPPQVMRKRVEETLDLMGLADLRERPLLTLSGGQRQRVAIGAVLTTHPQVLVLDEPTSALDPQAAEEVLAALQRLVYDLGLTVIIAEHRLERVIQYVDQIAILQADGSLTAADPATAMITSPVAPPVVQLGRFCQWEPLPMSVRDARRRAISLRRELASTVTPAHAEPVGDWDWARGSLVHKPPALPHFQQEASTTASTSAAPLTTDEGGAPTLRFRNVAVRYGSVTALRSASLTVSTGSVTALMGRNGAGKSTLLRTAIGLTVPNSGTVRVAGVDPRKFVDIGLLGNIGLVPQEPADLLYADSVAKECRHSDRDAGLMAGTTAALLAEIAPDIAADTHPHDLSEGQRLLLVLALVLATNPPALLLDEPTRGLDYPAKAQLAALLRARALAGVAILMATHDVEMVAECADHVAILADGEVVAHGPTAAIVTSSPIFSPQVAKVLAPLPLLTVTEVARSQQVPR